MIKPSKDSEESFGVAVVDLSDDFEEPQDEIKRKKDGRVFK